MAQVTVAHALARLLEQMGTEVIFGVNGHGNWAFLDAVVHETKIRGIPARLEDQAVHMADGYWRVRRKAPLAIATTSVGPGNMNTVPAIANAFYESVALMLIAAAGPTHWFDRGGMQESYRSGPEDWVTMLKPITKKAVMVTRPDNALDMVLRAYHTAVSGRPGPVVVQIPLDIQHALISDELPEPTPWMQWHPPAPDPDGVKEAAALLAAAERPLVMVGSGIHNARAWDELLRFAEIANIPVATTSTAKGAFPEAHRLSLGCIGAAGTGQAHEAARGCDVVLGVGTHFTDVDTQGWTLFDIPGKTRLIHIDIDPTELGRAYPAAVALNCDARLGLAALAEAVGAHGTKLRAAWLGLLDQSRQSWSARVASDRHSDLAPLHYARICNDTGEVVAAMNPEMPIFFDTGHLLTFTPPFMAASSRNLAHGGFYHRMGWSASAIIGASVARGNAPALALLGDGSFLMSGAAVATAVEQGLPLVWVVLNNRSLQVERDMMSHFYGRTAFCDYRIIESGELWNPDLILWAKAMGADAIKVSRPEDYAPALRRALEARKPFLLDVDVDINIEAYREGSGPPSSPWPMNYRETWTPGKPK